jgi:transposase InsO family protein
VSHSRAKLNPFGRRLLCERIQAGFPVRVAARMVGISHARAYIIWHRYSDEGEAAFELRSSRPHRSPRRTPAAVEARIRAVRTEERRGPRVIGWLLGLAASTVYAVLRRLGLGHLRVFRDPRPVPRRYERAAPGDLGHMDTKKLARIGAGGGHRFRGRSGEARHRGIGYQVEHVLVDDRSRVAYRETLERDDAAAVAGFTERALAHFARLGVRFRQLMTDNALSYVRGRRFQELLVARGIEHVRIPPYTPRWNGKAEAFIKILLRECAYARPYPDEREREAALQRFDHHYHFRRPHGGLGGLTPMQRLAQDLVNNVPGSYS